MHDRFHPTACSPIFILITALASLLVISNTNGTESNRMIIHGAHVFDTAKGVMVPDQSIVIEAGVIRAVGPASNIESSGTTHKIVDGRGKYVIPGLIDAHVHLVHLANKTRVTGDKYLPLFLAYGVTSVRDVGDTIVAQASIAHFAESQPARCPRVYLGSPLIDSNPPFHSDIGMALTDPAAVKGFVEDMAAWNVTTLKIYVGTSRVIAKEVIREAHRHGMKVTGHLGNYSAQEAAEDGIDSLEHIWSVFNYGLDPETQTSRANADLTNPRCQALIKLLADRKVAVDPTLIVFRNMIYLSDLEEVHNQPELRYVPKSMRAYWDQYRASHPLTTDTLAERRKEIDKYKELTGMLFRAGVPILAGTDAPEPYVIPGLALHQELEMLVESGLTPADAIRSATINNARILGQEDRIGMIEAGKVADLVILSADPTQNIRNTRSIEAIVRTGLLVDPDELLREFETD